MPLGFLLGYVALSTGVALPSLSRSVRRGFHEPLCLNVPIPDAGERGDVAQESRSPSRQSQPSRDQTLTRVS
jgi:hypothetical protein